MRKILITAAMVVLVMPAHAQSDDDWQQTRMALPETCADLGATPKRLEDGTLQYPLAPCRGVSYNTSFGDYPLRAEAEAEAAAYMAASPTVPQPMFSTNYPVKQPVRAVPAQPAVEPVQRPVAQPVVQPMDPVQEQEIGGVQGGFNNLQMMRLGELDAMQGRPLNMNYANDLGYVQGYTKGKTRQGTQAPRGFGW